MIEVRRLGFAWPDAAPVLSDLSFSIAAGEKVVLLGPNGCGKSTLLKLLNGLLEATTGEIRWQGAVLNRAHLRQGGQGRAFRRACALLFQHPEAMLFNPTVGDELAYGPRQLALPDIDARVRHWAAELALTPWLDKAPFLLSGGQKQKLALAALLILEPDCLLLDEPSASLDPRTVAWLIDLLGHSDRTLVVATHNLSLAAELGQRCLVFGETGQLLFDGPIRTALSDLPLLEAAGLAHRHRHPHGNFEHSHPHSHDWS